MKLRGPIFFSLLTILLLAAAVFPQADNANKETVLLQTLLRGLNQFHYDPQQIDDDFSQKVFDLYLDDVDGGKRFFTQADVDQLVVYRNDIDDESQAGSYEFFDLTQTLLRQALDKTQTYYREILSQPFDFSNKEAVELDGDKRQWAKNDTELREFWRKYLKYEVLSRYADALESQEKAGEEGEKKTTEELEKEARKDVLEMYDRLYDRLNELDREDRLGQYLNNISSTFDPHTNYYSPVDKETFDITFSGKLEGIGARLSTDGDYTKVSEIIVGGPAWRSKEIQENDMILKVAQGNDEPVDIKGMQIDDVVQLIRGPKGTKVRLTIRKVDGAQEEIVLIRDVVIIDERFAKSLILDGASKDEKVGYIYLPSFYADFEDQNGRNCADDVAKEIEKLKAAQVDGIILDLRNNGGGSLRDVVKMSGYFIEKGPVVQVKARNYDPEVLMDVDPRVQYDGPLVVMVNNFSASASEILAAALQDYGRAVIVGSNSTFGKGTVQRFIDLDRTIRGQEEVKPLGQVKLTIQKFYRINGGSTQMRGVTPDVTLPDTYNYIKVGEKEERYAMEWSEIDPVNYSQRVFRLDNLDKIQQRSMERVKQNPTFQRVNQNAERIKRQREMTNYSLYLGDFLATETKMKDEAKRYDGMFEEVINPGVFNLETDLPSIHADESKEARNKDFIETVSKDVYIKESVNIIHDVIALKK